MKRYDLTAGIGAALLALALLPLARDPLAHLLGAATLLALALALRSHFPRWLVAIESWLDSLDDS
jgi:hypothetical protein